jgi:class 3 adenylate cyclase/pimeloyl-ACP methyl ester carboxylesterase
MAQSEFRYCTMEDGARIAYSVEGSGPALIVTPFFVESFSTHAMLPELQAFLARLGEGRTLVRWDQSNMGLSQQGVSWPDAATNGDLEAVINALECDAFAICGLMNGGWRAIDAAVRWSDRVDRIALVETFPIARAILPREQVDAMAMLARTNWELGAQMYADLTTRSQYPEQARLMAQMFTKSVSGVTAAKANAWGYEHIDVQDKLGMVQCPTLILHRRDDPQIPITIAQEMAQAIPGARFVQLEGNVTQPFLGDSQPILDALDAFFPKEHLSAAQSPSRSGVTTILFTDLVGHTEMMQRLGDDRGREVLREHERITRELLKQHGGVEVKTMGDGFMASFGSVTKAMDCAIALQRAFATHTESMPEPLQVRVGLNAGEPIEEDGDLFGSTVIMASRIAAQAGAGEILIPEPLRHLLSGKSYIYADRGETMLKGFEDTVRVFEVRWKD